MSEVRKRTFLDHKDNPWRSQNFAKVKKFSRIGALDF